MKEILEKLKNKQNLSFEESKLAFEILMNGKARDFIILEDVNAEDFVSESFGIQNNIMIPCSSSDVLEDCNNRYWCEWNELDGVCKSNEKDLLFVANELDGLLIYEIIVDDELDFSLIYSNNGFEYTDDPLENILDLELRSIEYSETNNTLYVLDKFEFIYQIFLPSILIADEYKQYCNNSQEAIHSLSVGDLGTYHATKFILKENSGIIDGLFVLNKHNANNELYLEESYSEIQFESFESFLQPSGTSCEGNGAPITQTVSLLSEEDALDYNISDIAFSEDVFIVSNPVDEYFSLNAYAYSEGEVSNKVETFSPNKVLSTSLVNDYLYAGVKETGCYITLLPGDGILDENDNILNMPDNFSVYDIQYQKIEGQEFLLLSCGSNGVLVYSDTNQDGLITDANFRGHIISSHAYVAKMFNDNIVFVGTKNGIEIYTIN